MNKQKMSARKLATLHTKYLGILKSRLTGKELDVVFELLEIERELTLREGK